MNNENVIEIMRNELKTYCTTNGIKALVLGISGGIDSAVCAALARPVCDELGIQLIGRSLPTSSNDIDEIERAIIVGETFCTKFKEESISSITEAIFSKLTGLRSFRDDDRDLSNDDKIRYGNVKARTRMIYLYDLAAFYEGMVLSTDNFTEYLLGFWTLHGDVGDFGMIQELMKSEVYDIADCLADGFDTDSPEALALDRCINATATDGLGITNSDIDQLCPELKTMSSREAYKRVDIAIANGLRNPQSKQSVTRAIVKKMKATEFKRINPYSIPIETLMPEQIENDI